MARYSFAVANGNGGTALQHEFKLLVREAHKRGIEVRGGLGGQGFGVREAHKRGIEVGGGRRGRVLGSGRHIRGGLRWGGGGGAGFWGQGGT